MGKGFSAAEAVPSLKAVCRGASKAFTKGDRVVHHGVYPTYHRYSLNIC